MFPGCAAFAPFQLTLPDYKQPKKRQALSNTSPCFQKPSQRNDAISILESGHVGAFVFAANALGLALARNPVKTTTSKCIFQPIIIDSSVRVDFSSQSGSSASLTVSLTAASELVNPKWCSSRGTPFGAPFLALAASGQAYEWVAGISSRFDCSSGATSAMQRLLFRHSPAQQPKTRQIEHFPRPSFVVKQRMSFATTLIDTRQKVSFARDRIGLKSYLVKPRSRRFRTGEQKLKSEGSEGVVSKKKRGRSERAKPLAVALADWG